jgi:hypothetical protein
MGNGGKRAGDPGTGVQVAETTTCHDLNAGPGSHTGRRSRPRSMAGAECVSAPTDT